jgi:acetolactate synthase-1/3 small subunit
MEQPITFLVWTENSPGVLLRLTTIFTRRKINVESLTVSATETAGVARFTIVVHIQRAIASTIGRQIERMIDTRRVFVYSDDAVLHREVALVRARISTQRQSALCAQYPALVVLHRAEHDNALFQLVGTESEIHHLLVALGQEQITEVVRSGRIAVTLSGAYENGEHRSIHEQGADPQH